MKLSDSKWAPDCIGFAVLLLLSLRWAASAGCVCPARRGRQPHHATVNWEKARLTMEMEARTRDNAFKSGRLLMADNDTDAQGRSRTKCQANTSFNSAALEQLEKLLVSPRKRTLLAEAAEARERYMASRAEVTKLAADTKTQAEALDLYNRYRRPDGRRT